MTTFANDGLPDENKSQEFKDDSNDRNSIEIFLKPHKDYIRNDKSIASTTSRDLNFIFDIILKEVVTENVLVRQICYTMLSAYTKNPINLAINAPSGEGKTHGLKMIGSLFPKTDTVDIIGMSSKALFHQTGYIAVRDEDGEYVEVESELQQLKDAIPSKKSKLSEIKKTDSNSVDTISQLEKEIRKDEQRIRYIEKNAVKLIELVNKILVFLDTPNPTLFEAILPLLSHDKYEVEYQFVDTANRNGIQTKTNVLRGWPAVIFAQAIDSTHHPRYPEIQRRFIVTNPRMDEEKYKGAINYILEKNCVPDFVYQQKIVNDKDKEEAKEIILNIRDDILSISSKTKPGKNIILIPFYHQVRRVLLSKKNNAQDMNFTNRLMNLVSLLTIINHKRRPYIEITPAFSSESITIPMSLFSDLKEALTIIKDSPGGIRPYVLEWYHNVFLELYKSKSEPNRKITSDRGEITEERIAVTTQELIEKTKAVLNKPYTTKSILSEFIYPLLNIGYIDKLPSEIDRRAKIYYAVVISDKNSNLFSFSEKNKLFNENMKKSQDSSIDDDRLQIISYIEGVMKYYSENGDLVCIKRANSDINPSNEEDDNEYTSTEEIVDQYYFGSLIKNKDDIKHKQEVDSFIHDNTSELPFSEEYTQLARNSIILQKKYEDDKENINRDYEQSNNLFSEHKKNKMIYSCYYCDFATNMKLDYERHIVSRHEGKFAYPSIKDLVKYDLKPKGYEWE